MLQIDSLSRLAMSVDEVCALDRSRISDPEALRWSNRCRILYSDFNVDYEQYAMGTLDDRCFVIQTPA